MAAATCCNLQRLIADARDERAKYLGGVSLHAQRAAAVQLLDDRAATATVSHEARSAARELLSSMAPTSSTTAVAEPPAQALALRKWLDDFLDGELPPPLTLRSFELTGRGLAAGPDGLAAGDVALRIPEHLVLTSAGLPAHALLDGWYAATRRIPVRPHRRRTASTASPRVCAFCVCLCVCVCLRACS